ncbi:capZ-interacting protein-like isoform X2 [Myxocyprinus asiaticus]|uniref:capZ-interacting protein-like isoform X2 n=1 Tax=Myxocyprinus asiaticus TaxID=70543 RepID=UPI00222394A8|nr:capZ-interacting protein-like isoform X2 [Myxocyprinus asiaticus]
MENKPVRMRPPRSLQLPANNDAGQCQDEKGAATTSSRKNRNSALIEKLQASLTMSPVAPPTIPKSLGVVKLPVLPFSPVSPSSPSSSPAVLMPKEEEAPASFEDPAEGNVLKSINKGRARLSIKRRPPSRRHRKSSTDEGGEEVDKTASVTFENTTPNAHEGDVFEKQKSSNRADTASLSSKEQSVPKTKSTDTEKASPKEEEPDEKVETVTSEKKGEEKEEKTEQEQKEEKSNEEPQLADNTESTVQEEAREEPVTQQTEPDTTTDGKEKEQNEEAEVKH